MNPLSASYFQQLQQALTEAGLAEPVLVIDRDRLDTNIAALKAMLPEGMAYRIVAKSLPCAELLEYVAAHTETHRLMSFNTNMVTQLLALILGLRSRAQPLRGRAHKERLSQQTPQCS